MSVADNKYKQLIRDTLEEGEWDTDGEVRPVYADGTPAHSKSIFGVQVVFEPGEIPVITSKKAPVNSSINEVVHGFWIEKTNDLKRFRELGIKYWDEWATPEDTIGDSYGIQLRDQRELVTFDKDLKIETHYKDGAYEEDMKKGDSVYLDQVENVLYRLRHDPYSRRIMFSYWNPGAVHSKALQECAYAGQFNVRNGRLDMILKQR